MILYEARKKREAKEKEGEGEGVNPKRVKLVTTAIPKV